MRDELENFKKKYRAHVQEGHRRYAVPKRMNMDGKLIVNIDWNKKND